MTSHTLKWKKSQGTGLVPLINRYPTIALANIEHFPANLFQRVRKKLQGKAVVRVSKTQVIKKAFEESDKKDSKLKEQISHMTAIIFTDMNPFELYAFLKKNRDRTFVKPGALAPEDILVPAGDTGMPPGPALSDLKNAGLPVKVQGPTIHISKDTIVTKKGEVVSKAVAATLSKLNIKPVKVGLNVISVLENKDIFSGDVLDIDEEKVFEQFKTARFYAFNLALNIEYYTAETTPLFVQKAYRDAKAVAMEGNIVTPETVGAILAKAERQGNALAALVHDEPAAKTEEKTETKAEEKADGTAEGKADAKAE